MKLHLLCIVLILIFTFPNKSKTQSEFQEDSVILSAISSQLALFSEHKKPEYLKGLDFYIWQLSNCKRDWDSIIWKEKLNQKLTISFQIINLISEQTALDFDLPSNFSPFQRPSPPCEILVDSIYLRIYDPELIEDDSCKAIFIRMLLAFEVHVKETLDKLEYNSIYKGLILDIIAFFGENGWENDLKSNEMEHLVPPILQRTIESEQNRFIILQDLGLD